MPILMVIVKCDSAMIVLRGMNIQSEQRNARLNKNSVGSGRQKLAMINVGIEFDFDLQCQSVCITLKKLSIAFTCVYLTRKCIGKPKMIDEIGVSI